MTGGKVAQRGLSIFIAFLPQRRTQAALVGENKVGEARFMCASDAFWCEIPRDPYMVKAERECEAEGSDLLSLSGS